MSKSMGFDIVFFYDSVWCFLLAGPERIELPPHGSKPRILSIELKAGIGATNEIRTHDLILTKDALYR